MHWVLAQGTICRKLTLHLLEDGVLWFSDTLISEAPFFVTPCQQRTVPSQCLNSWPPESAKLEYPKLELRGSADHPRGKNVSAQLNRLQEAPWLALLCPLRPELGLREGLLTSVPCVDGQVEGR